MASRVSFIENNLNHISKCLDYHSSKYDNFTVMRAFNDGTGNIIMK